MVELPRDFLSRAERELGDEFTAFLKSYEVPPVRGIRVNTLKLSKEEFEKITPIKLDGEVPWAKDCYYTNEENLGRHVLHAAGAYYVQEPSAACAAPELEVKTGERVLDLCSAPGGKGTQLAQDMRGAGVLVLNEIIPKRAEILRSNVERMGVANALITSCDAQKLSTVFDSYFDKILVDAPCSGEGMFKKEKAAIPEWSLESVALCARRQESILSDAAKMLAAGGRLVYSTCTFSREEDELQVSNFIAAHPEFTLIKSKKLMPHKVRGEGHFCAVFEKRGCERRDLPVIVPQVHDKKLLNSFMEWSAKTLKTETSGLSMRNKSLYSVSCGTPDLSKYKIPLSYGVYLGGLSADGKRFEPSHSLAMTLSKERANCVEIDENTAKQYLRGLTFNCDAPDGWRVVTYLGLPLGWCKVVKGVAKNHLPKGLRI